MARPRLTSRQDSPSHAESGFGPTLPPSAPICFRPQFLHISGGLGPPRSIWRTSWILARMIVPFALTSVAAARPAAPPNIRTARHTYPTRKVTYGVALRLSATMTQGPAKRTYLISGAMTVDVLRLEASVVAATSIWLKAESNAVSLALTPANDVLPTLMDTVDTGSRNLISAGKAGLVPSKIKGSHCHAKKLGGLCPLTKKLLHSSSTAPSPRTKKLFVTGFMYGAVCERQCFRKRTRRVKVDETWPGNLGSNFFSGYPILKLSPGREREEDRCYTCEPFHSPSPNKHGVPPLIATVRHIASRCLFRLEAALPPLALIWISLIRTQRPRGTGVKRLSSGRN